MLSGMVFSTGVDFFLSFPGVADADADEEDEEADDDEDEELDDDSVSRGGMLSADSTVASPDAEEPPKRPLILPAGIEYEIDTDKKNIRGNIPEMLSSLISPNTTASDTDTKPDSERVRVALTTGSTAPLSVMLAMASATSPISTSSIRVGNPLQGKI